MILTSIIACALSLNGSWDFRFEEDRPLEAAAKLDFAARPDADPAQKRKNRIGES
jgi:hypothetical protein